MAQKRLSARPVGASTPSSSLGLWKQEFVIGGQPMILEITDDDCVALEAQFERFFKREE